MNKDQDKYLEKLKELKSQMADVAEIINRIEERMKDERIQSRPSGEKEPKQD